VGPRIGLDTAVAVSHYTDCDVPQTRHVVLETGSLSVYKKLLQPQVVKPAKGVCCISI